MALFSLVQLRSNPFLSLAKSSIIQFCYFIRGIIILITIYSFSLTNRGKKKHKGPFRSIISPICMNGSQV